MAPFTRPELAALRDRLDSSTPDRQAQTIATLATLPAEAVPLVSAGLANSKDGISQSYATALIRELQRRPSRTDDS